MIQQIVLSKNNLFFYFLLFGYIFGVVLYDFLKFDYTDELMAFFLVLFAGVTIWERKNIRELYPLMIVISIFLFYTAYSFLIVSNTPQAILKDFVIQIKPFIGFFCAWLLAPIFTKQQKQIICISCLIIGGVILIATLTGNTWTFFGHPSRLATSATVTALLFLYCCSFTWNDILIFIMLLSIGVLSTRSKFYGFFGVATFLIIYIKIGGELKFNLKGLLFFFMLICVAITLSWKKIVIYYLDGAMSSEQMWSRPAMMLTSLQILLDYFPLGCGLASFGTFASAEYYSKTYEEYGISHLYGLTKDHPAFITDAYYPELAQFGIIGVILYFTFWIWIIKIGTKKRYQNSKLFSFTLLVFLFFLIEGVADATFTHNRGLFTLILLGAFLSKDEK